MGRMEKDELDRVREWHMRCAASQRGRRGAVVQVNRNNFCLCCHVSHAPPQAVGTPGVVVKLAWNSLQCN